MCAHAWGLRKGGQTEGGKERSPEAAFLFLSFAAGKPLKTMADCHSV